MRKYRFPNKNEFFGEFVVPKGHCSLCGNSGVIDTRGVRTAAGVEVGGRFYCLCPNGRAMKEIANRARVDTNSSLPVG